MLVIRHLLILMVMGVVIMVMAVVIVSAVIVAALHALGHLLHQQRHPRHQRLGDPDILPGGGEDLLHPLFTLTAVIEKHIRL